MPKGRMGPPLRSFAADAHDYIMVRVLGPNRIQGCGAIDRARKRAPLESSSRSHQSLPSCSKLSRCGLATAELVVRLVRRPTLTASARASASEVRVGNEETALRSNKETDK